MMLIASIPYLSEDGNSLMYFQDIKKLGEEKYKEKSKEQTEDELLEDLREQSFLLATGLSKKFNRLKLAYYLCIFQVIMLIPLIIQVLTHFKK